MPTRPGHVTLSISFVALIVAVMSTQYCSSAPCLGQPINGATHTAGNREMGLKVSHDQYRGIVKVSALLTAAVLPCRRKQAVQRDHHTQHGTNTTSFCRAASCHAIIGLVTCTIIFTAISWRRTRPIGSVLSIFGTACSVVGDPKHRPPTSLCLALSPALSCSFFRSR
jgi:hypothetical protein